MRISNRRPAPNRSARGTLTGRCASTSGTSRDGAIGLGMMSSKPTAETRASSSFDTKPENARIDDVAAPASSRSSPTSVEAVGVGQHEVLQHDARLLARHQLARGRAVGRLDDLVACASAFFTIRRVAALSSTTMILCARHDAALRDVLRDQLAAAHACRSASSRSRRSPRRSPSPDRPSSRTR